MLRFTGSLTLLLAALAPQASAQWVLANHTDLLGVDDAEFTPDGRYVVVRDNTVLTTADVYDAQTGQRVFRYMPAQGSGSGVCQDAVALTNERAVVLGSRGLVLNLSNLTLLAEHDFGAQPRDVVVTPDGSFAAVRGGSAMYVIELQNGSIVAQAAGNAAEYQGTLAFDVDSVVASDTHAVMTSEIGTGSSRSTRVTIFELRPSGGGPPVVVFETTTANDLSGKPNDLALTPNGALVAVRSDNEVGLYELNGSATQQRWRKRLFGSPGPFRGNALDSIEATATRIATISYLTNGGFGTQLDVFDLQGNQRYARLAGQPHDVCLTPNDQRAAVRTRDEVALFDLRILPPGDLLTPLDVAPLPSTYTSYNAGLDSIVATDRHVAALARTGSSSTMAIWDIRGDQLAPFYEAEQPDRALDLEVSPGAERVIFGFYKSFRVVDLRTASSVLAGDGTSASGSLTWCDGVAINDTHAAAFGVGAINGHGWISLLDLFEQPVRYCDTNENSTGLPGVLSLSGSASVADNNLVLWAAQLPPSTVGLFFYGDIATQIPFGDGNLCVAGNVGRFQPLHASASGVAQQIVDYNNLPPSGGAILPGSSWNFQHFYRDNSGTLAPFNTTDALAITFGN